jgi:hypothetical protein
VSLLFFFGYFAFVTILPNIFEFFSLRDTSLFQPHPICGRWESFSWS